MIVFDRINSKENKSKCILPEETRVHDERSKLTELDHSATSQICETSTEVFGIGLEYSEEVETTKATTNPHDDGSNETSSLHQSTAIDIINRAQLSMATFQSLVNLNKSGSEISHRHFPYINTSITLFYNSKFSMDRDTNEHDERIDNILKGWSMSREHIAKDGDCCFRAVARNVYKLTETRGINTHAYEHLAHLGLVNLREESLSIRLRALTVSEWSGENRQQYESFLTTDNFDEEITRFTHKGYFTGELGNLMVLAMANVLKMPIVIFSSLEHYPTIPILPRRQLNDMPTLFVSFNAAFDSNSDPIFKELELLKLNDVRQLELGKLMFSFNRSLLPSKFNNYFSLNKQVHSYATRYANDFHLPFCRTNLRKFSVSFQGPTFYSSLNNDIKESNSLHSFRTKLKKTIYMNY